MDLTPFIPFIKHAEASPHAQMASIGKDLGDDVLEQDEERSTVDNVVHDNQLDQNKPKDEADIVLTNVMPELEQADEQANSQFGKVKKAGSLWDQLKQNIK